MSTSRPDSEISNDDDSRLEARRALLKASAAAPLVATLHPANALALSSAVNACIVRVDTYDDLGTAVGNVYVDVYTKRPKTVDSCDNDGGTPPQAQTGDTGASSLTDSNISLGDTKGTIGDQSYDDGEDAGEGGAEAEEVSIASCPDDASTSQTSDTYPGPDMLYLYPPGTDDTGEPMGVVYAEGDSEGDPWREPGLDSYDMEHYVFSHQMEAVAGFDVMASSGTLPNLHLRGPRLARGGDAISHSCLHSMLNKMGTDEESFFG